MCCFPPKTSLYFSIFLFTLFCVGSILNYFLWYLPQENELQFVANGYCVVDHEWTQLVWYGQYQKCQAYIYVVAVYKGLKYTKGLSYMLGYWDTCPNAQNYLNTFYPVGNIVGGCTFKKSDGTILEYPPSLFGPTVLAIFLLVCLIISGIWLCSSIYWVVKIYGCSLCPKKKPQVSKVDETSGLIN